MAKAWRTGGVLAALALGAALSAGELAGMGEKGRAVENVSIVVFGQPYVGDILPNATETDFKFRTQDGDVLTFRWTALAETERARVQKLLGFKGAQEPGLPEWGETVACMRLKLKGGRTIEGLEVPAQARAGFRALKTASQLVQVPKADVTGEEKIALRESQVYSPEQGYERLLGRKPPAKDSAGDQLELARACAAMTLYERALEHHKMAVTIDPRVEERTKEFVAEITARLKAQQADHLYLQVVTAMQRQDFPQAVGYCEQFLRTFPQDERKTKVELLREQLLPQKDSDFGKRVIQTYYNSLTDLIQARMAKRTKVDEQGRPVPVEPGKQVSTKGGKFRGKLLGEDPEKIVLQQDDLTMEISRAQILTVEDVDLSKGAKEVDPTFAELKSYVTAADAGGGAAADPAADPAAAKAAAGGRGRRQGRAGAGDGGSLGSDITARVSQALKADPDKVREAWEGRFVCVATLRDGVMDKPQTYYTPHTANYGKGSWLREGVQQLQSAQNPNANADAQQGNVTPASEEQARLHPEFSDDPEVWWRAQTPETKLDILRAMAAEKLFRVKQIVAKPCPECGSRGHIQRFNDMAPQRCPMCRGLKQLATIIYE